MWCSEARRQQNVYADKFAGETQASVDSGEYLGYKEGSLRYPDYACKFAG
jgi:hypothetical protein